jgi:hypothetical protein
MALMKIGYRVPFCSFTHALSLSIHAMVSFRVCILLLTSML